MQAFPKGEPVGDRDSGLPAPSVLIETAAPREEVLKRIVQGYGTVATSEDAVIGISARSMPRRRASAKANEGCAASGTKSRPIAVEALRVIGAAMAEAGVVGLGRLTLSRRERMVMAARSVNSAIQIPLGSTIGASARFEPLG